MIHEKVENIQTHQNFNTEKDNNYDGSFTTGMQLQILTEGEISETHAGVVAHQWRTLTLQQRMWIYFPGSI